MVESSMSWPHQEVQEKALRYIEKASMEPDTWKHTRIGVFQDPIGEHLKLQHGELPLISCYFSRASWYAFTTLWILGNYHGWKVDEIARDLKESNFSNFKGYGQKGTEVMTLRFLDGKEKRLEYETGKPSMAPIYAIRYWKIKFPVLARKYNLH